MSIPGGVRFLRALALCAPIALFPATSTAQPQRFTDSANRAVPVSSTIDRVYAAGAPASVMVYALPEKLIGWTRAVKAQERPFFPNATPIFPSSGA